jgi:hypothetical protein
MSESIDYRVSVGGAGDGRALEAALSRRGILSLNREAWLAAEQRVIALEKSLSEMDLGEELNATCESPAASIRRLESMLNAFDRIEPFRAAGEMLRGSELEKIKSSIRMFKQAALSGAAAKSLLDQIEDNRLSLEKIASEVHETLCRAEHEASFAIIAEGLEEMGYRVEKRGDQIRALQGSSCIWVSADELGAVKMDFSGYSGLSCIQQIQKVESVLKKRGLELHRRASDYHGRPEGGVLARQLRPVFSPFQGDFKDRTKGPNSHLKRKEGICR